MVLPLHNSYSCRPREEHSQLRGHPNLSDIIRRFKMGIIEGNAGLIQSQLDRYPQCQKELLDSVSLQDLARLKTAELFPRWEGGVGGGCHEKENDDHLIVDVEDDLCIHYHRVPPTNSFDKVTNFLFTLVTEMDEMDETVSVQK